VKKVRKQKILLSIGSIFYTLIIFAILVLVNYISIRHYSRFDVTGSKIFTLSEKSINIAKKLEKDVSITVLYSRTMPVYNKLENLLKEYSHHSKRIKAVLIDPDLDVSHTQMIAQKYNIETANRIIIECEEKVKHLTDSDIGDFDLSSVQQGGEPALRKFKGEQAITSALLSVTEDKQLKIAFIEGHGEKSISINSDQGLSKLKEALERDNYEVVSLKLLGENKLTKEDTRVVLIIRPLLKFTEDEIKLFVYCLICTINSRWHKMKISPGTFHGNAICFYFFIVRTAYYRN